jgi:DDE superfamily endonuclease
MLLHLVRSRPMSTTALPVPPILATLIGRIAAAVPGRARATFTELLIGAAVTRGGHVTDAILAVGLSRAWTTYYWLLERGRWSWLAVWRALLGALEEPFAPPVWHVVIDGTVVERISTRAPGSLLHRNHSAKPNRSRFLRGQGWLCLAAVVERGWRVGAVPLMLRLVRRGTHRGKLRSARFLLRLPGRRLGRVRLLLDAWCRRARLIEAAVADGHTVIGRVRRDLALYAVPRPLRRRRRGRPRKYGERLTRAKVEALPVHRSARILYGQLEVVRYRTCRVAARFLEGRVVRAVWVELERPDRRDRPAEERLLLCTDPDLPATEVITSYAKRWSVEPLFAAMRHGWGLKDAWQRSRQGLMRWVTILAAGYASAQMLAYADPARIPSLADPAPWRPPGTRTAGLIQAGIGRLLRGVGLPALVAAIPPEFRPDSGRSAGRPPPVTARAA